MGMVSEFKEFIARGNVVDLAVGVVIGAAFGKIVTALVDGIVMPVIGAASGGVSVSDWKYVLSPAQLDAAGKEVAAEVAVKYGLFLQTLIDFVLIAFVIFAAGATISLFVWADLPLVALGFAALAGSLVLGARQWR